MLESKFVRLEFVEITSYKRNVHLSVQLNRGTDKMVCKHLTNELKILRTQNIELARTLAHCQEEIKEKSQSLKLAENKVNEEKARQAENEAIFQKRLEDEFLKERIRTEETIKEIK